MPNGGCQGTKEWITDEVTDECPVKWIGELRNGFEAHSWLDKGILPHAGGWADQNADLMRCASIVSEEYNKAQRSS